MIDRLTKKESIHIYIQYKNVDIYTLLISKLIFFYLGCKRMPKNKMFDIDMLTYFII